MPDPFTVDLSGGITELLGQIKNLGVYASAHRFVVDTYEENLILLDKPNDAFSRRRVLWTVCHSKINTRDLVRKRRPNVAVSPHGFDQSSQARIDALEQIDSMTLTATSQGSVVNDCGVAEKLSNSCVLGKGVGVKGKDLNGCTSSGQGKDLEADLIKMKAESDEGLKKLSQIKDIIMQIISQSLKPTDYSAGI
ncbi:unnamed protein product [Camellia sinensis]